jgi:hypothetical protein
VPPGLAILLASPRAMVRLAHCRVFVLSC